MFERRGQIWVETVIYTLIALVLIGSVLAFIVPRIQEIQDKAITDQSVEILQNIEEIVSSTVVGGAGNKRIVELRIKKGELTIDGETDKIIFSMDSSNEYSEVGVNVSIGDIVALTEKSGSSNKITLTSNYSAYNITYSDQDISKTLTSSSTPYKLSIENKGGSKTVIDFVAS